MAKLLNYAVDSVLTVIVRYWVSKPMDTEVHEALLNQENQGQDIELLQKIVRSSPTVLLQTNKRKETLLHLAACHGNVNFVDAILDLHKHCPVWWIQRWPLVKSTNYQGNSVLHEAATAGHTHLVKYLVGSYPTLVEQVNWFGETALFLACENGHEDVVRQILAHAPQVEPGRTTKDGQTCFHVAAYRGYTGVLRILSEMEGGCEYLDQTDECGATALHSAVDGGNVDAVKYLVNYKASLCDKFDGQGRCPIHVAARKGDCLSIDIMLDKNPDYAGIVCCDGKTILHYAAEYSQCEVVDRIRQQRCLYRLYGDERDRDGNRPLHLAMKTNAGKAKAMMEMLVTHFPQVKPNVKNNVGLTPLDVFYSCSDGDTDGAGESDQKEKAFLEEAAIRLGLRVSKKNVYNEEARSDRERINKLMEINALIATLLATVSAAAPFQLSDNICLTSDEMSLTLYKDCQDNLNAMTWFLFWNSGAFWSSCTVLLIWLLCEGIWTHTLRPWLLASVTVLSLALVSESVAVFYATRVARWRLDYYYKGPDTLAQAPTATGVQHFLSPTAIGFGSVTRRMELFSELVISITIFIMFTGTCFWYFSATPNMKVHFKRFLKSIFRSFLKGIWIFSMAAVLMFTMVRYIYEGTNWKLGAKYSYGVVVWLVFFVLPLALVLVAKRLKICLGN